MTDFLDNHINAAQAAIEAGDIRDLSSAEAADGAMEVYKQWLKETGFVDALELRQAYTSGWIAGAVAATEKLTAVTLKLLDAKK